MHPLFTSLPFPTILPHLLPFETRGPSAGCWGQEIGVVQGQTEDRYTGHTPFVRRLDAAAILLLPPTKERTEPSYKFAEWPHPAGATCPIGYILHYLQLSAVKRRLCGALYLKRITVSFSGQPVLHAMAHYPAEQDIL